MWRLTLIAYYVFVPAFIAVGMWMEHFLNFPDLKSFGAFFVGATVLNFSLLYAIFKTELVSLPHGKLIEWLLVCAAGMLTAFATDEFSSIAGYSEKSWLVFGFVLAAANILGWQVEDETEEIDSDTRHATPNKPFRMGVKSDQSSAPLGESGFSMFRDYVSPDSFNQSPGHSTGPPETVRQDHFIAGLALARFQQHELAVEQLCLALSVSAVLSDGEILEIFDYANALFGASYWAMVSTLVLHWLPAANHRTDSLRVSVAKYMLATAYAYQGDLDRAHDLVVQHPLERQPYQISNNNQLSVQVRNLILVMLQLITRLHVDNQFRLAHLLSEVVVNLQKFL